jgi:hypothetical protein
LARLPRHEPACYMTTPGCATISLTLRNACAETDTTVPAKAA